MGRKLRAEVAGGLYHLITRGNNRRPIFKAPADYEKFLALLAVQKARLPFFLYAYCLMTNHVHLLIERQANKVGCIMHRLLTGYSRYYNRRYRRVGHLLQGRHKAILCQSDRYLSELVRYIHLNPVRARMVSQPEQYKYSSHRAYLGLEATGIVDVDPVLRHFGVDRQTARQRYCEFVWAGMKDGHREDLYLTDEGRILGTEEFVDATIHRLGEVKRSPRRVDPKKTDREFELEKLVGAIERILQLPSREFCGSIKTPSAVQAKELLILIGRLQGVSLKRLSEITGLNSSTVSRRHDAARLKMQGNETVRKLVASICRELERPG
jgi:REP element-mobilizing transposase RayT